MTRCQYAVATAIRVPQTLKSRMQADIIFGLRIEISVAKKQMLLLSKSVSRLADLGTLSAKKPVITEKMEKMTTKMGPARTWYSRPCPE